MQRQEKVAAVIVMDMYNTDGLVFSLAGYPVILLNEHLNHDEDLIELATSPLFEAMVTSETKLRRPLSDAELQVLLADDRKLDRDEAAGTDSVVNRVTTWFAGAGLAPITDAEIIAELRHLRLQR
jgi:hypothetical protein